MATTILNECEKQIVSNELALKEEAKQVWLDVIMQMKAFTAPSLSQICGNIDENTGELLGTGTLMSFQGRLYLVSAQHVAIEMLTEVTVGKRKYPMGLSHSVGTGHHMLNILNPWTAWASPVDVAATRISTGGLAQMEVHSICMSKFALDTNDLENDLYFVQGFPGSQSRFTAFAGRGVASTSLPFGGWLCDSGWSAFDPKMHFAITFPASEVIDEQNKARSLPHPGGMSGSLIWKSNRQHVGAEWTPNHAEIVGVAQRYDQDKQCLVVTRVEYVKGLLLQLLRSEYAYFRWIERGRPTDDALDDWLAAESAIPSLSGM
jgi:Protein of unknown function (DUF2934)